MNPNKQTSLYQELLRSGMSETEASYTIADLKGEVEAGVDPVDVLEASGIEPLAIYVEEISEDA